MQQQRSKSRQKINPTNKQKGQSETRKYQSSQFQRGASNDRKISQRIPPNSRQFVEQYLGVNTVQMKKSPSPNRMAQDQLKNVSNLQKLSFKQISNRNITSIEDLAIFLRSKRKPFLSSDAAYLQNILQRLSPKYAFQQIYQVFVYFFIHSSTLDQNLYKVFYSIINRKDQAELQNLSKFYEILIRATLKTVFQELKVNIQQISLQDPSLYYTISSHTRQIFINKSLYWVNQNTTGCSARSALALIRKAMQRQKVNDRSSQSIHPINQILKTLKQVIKSILKKICMQSKKEVIQSEQKCKQNTFYLLLISELSLILHFKFKDKMGKQFQLTVNQITLQKMRLSQIKQQIRTKMRIKQSNSTNIVNYSYQINKTQKVSHNKEDQTIKALQTSYQQFYQQNRKNYFYLLFLLNLSAHNKNQTEQSDYSILNFYLDHILEENRKSSQFLYKKINQRQKLAFFNSIIKNYGINQMPVIVGNINTNSKLSQTEVFMYDFYYNILFRSINYLALIGNDKIAMEIQGKSNQSMDKFKYNIEFLIIFTSICPIASTFKQIQNNEKIKNRIKELKNAQLLKPELNRNHLIKQFDYLIKVITQNLIITMKKNYQKLFQNIKKLQKVQIRKISFQQHKTKNKDDKKVINIEADNYQAQSKQRQRDMNKIVEWIKQMKNILQRQSYYKIVLFIYMLYKNEKIIKVVTFQQYLIQSLKDIKKSQLNIVREDKQQGDQLPVAESQIYVKLVQKIGKVNKNIIELNNYQCIILQTLMQQIWLQKYEDRIRVVKNNQSCLKQLQNISTPLNQIKNDTIFGQVLLKLKLQEQIHKKTIQKIKNFLLNKQDSTSRNDYLTMNNNEQQKQETLNTLIKQFSNNLKKVINLKQQRQNPQEKIRILLNIKKIILIQKQLYEQINSIINIILNLYKLKEKNNLQLKLIESALDAIFLDTFKLYTSYQKNKHYSFNFTSFQSHNQKQKQLLSRKAITNTFKIDLIKQNQQKQVQINQKDQINNSIEQTFANILQTIYFKLISSFDQLTHSDSKQNQSSQNSNERTLQPTYPSLQQIMIIKIKKCISLFYDKINDHMLNQLIINNNIFILRSLVITFYKLKSLCQMFIVKYGCFDKIKINQKNNQQKSINGNQYFNMKIYNQVKKVFFNVKNRQLLQPYLKFILSKDIAYLKYSLISKKQIFNTTTQNSLRYQELIKNL